MATVAAPIDATSTAAWKALEAHQEKLEAEGIDRHGSLPMQSA